MGSTGLHALIDITEAEPDRLRLVLSRPVARVIDTRHLRAALPIIEGQGSAGAIQADSYIHG
jgi:hypothetical protein